MKESVKQEWIAALRSGEYKQCAGVLHNSNQGFCCLGVLADTAVDAEWRLNGNRYQLTGSGGKECMCMISSFAPELGLPPEEEQILANMNDRGCTFSEIADYIEENL